MFGALFVELHQIGTEVHLPNSDKEWEWWVWCKGENSQSPSEVLQNLQKVALTLQLLVFVAKTLLPESVEDSYNNIQVHRLDKTAQMIRERDRQTEYK